VRRRDFIALIGGAAAAPLVVRAQQPGKVWRIGYLYPGTLAAVTGQFDAFRSGLRALGYAEGENVRFERRFADGHFERLPALAAELVELRVDLILTASTPAIQALGRATKTIPVVFAAAGDPVASGLVASLARPGANITGLSNLATELTGKRLELAREVFGDVRRLAILYNPSDAGATTRVGEAQRATRPLGMTLRPYPAQSVGDLDMAFDSMTKEKPNVLLVVFDPFSGANQRRIVEFAARSRIFAIYEAREFVQGGGLLSFGANIAANYRRAASYVDKIFKGAAPNDLPVEQPTQFELVVNLKTAKALGLTIPQAILVRADEVIE
jgi:putative ABC transport system substrate-binding protein